MGCSGGLWGEPERGLGRVLEGSGGLLEEPWRGSGSSGRGSGSPWEASGEAWESRRLLREAPEGSPEPHRVLAEEALDR